MPKKTPVKKILFFLRHHLTFIFPNPLEKHLFHSGRRINEKPDERTITQIRKSENGFQKTCFQYPYPLKTEYIPPRAFSYSRANPFSAVSKNRLDKDNIPSPKVLTAEQCWKFSTSRFRPNAPGPIGPGLIPPSHQLETGLILARKKPWQNTLPIKVLSGSV